MKKLLIGLLVLSSVSSFASECGIDAQTETLSKIKSGWFSVNYDERSQGKFMISDIKMAAQTQLAPNGNEELTQVVFSYTFANFSSEKSKELSSIVGSRTYDENCKPLPFGFSALRVNLVQ